MKPIDDSWVVAHGSVFTLHYYPADTDFNPKGVPARTIISRKVIMSNVGEKVAKHVVDLHNATIRSST